MNWKGQILGTHNLQNVQRASPTGGKKTSQRGGGTTGKEDKKRNKKNAKVEQRSQKTGRKCKESRGEENSGGQMAENILDNGGPKEKVGRPLGAGDIILDKISGKKGEKKGGKLVGARKGEYISGK